MDVWLQVNVGTSWPIGLSSRNGHVFFDIGWVPFYREYGLERGFILRFKYIGSSFFKVVIKDREANQLYVNGDESRVHVGFVWRNQNILDDGPVNFDGYGTDECEQYINFFQTGNSSSSHDRNPVSKDSS